MRRRRYLVRLIIQILGVQCMLIGGVLVLAWLVGRVLSDRYLFSQWLLWIPTPAMLPAVLLGLIGSLAPGRKPRLKRRRLRVWALLALCIACYFGLIEHKLLKPAPPAEGDLTISHWNMTAWNTDDDRLQVLDWLSDLTILVDAWGLQRNTELMDTLPEDFRIIRVRRLTILTRLEVIETRPLIARDLTNVILLRLNCTESLGRELVVYVVDLPSDPKMSRMAIAADLRKLLSEVDAPRPDVVVGDFNMTRNGVAFQSIFPELHHAFVDGGHGYAASFHRLCPLYHIDHILLDDALRAGRYDLIDHDLGRHRLQKAWISPAD